MIRIRHHNLNSIASQWAEELKKFLTVDKIAAYRTFFYGLCAGQKFNGVAATTKDRVWNWIERFLSNKDNFIGDAKFFSKWIAFHETNIINNPLRLPIKKVFEKIYGEFSATVAYTILESLNIRTCPYCNRHYTFTVTSKRGKFKTRPEFDHFLDKATYPFFAVTFFNLIPSCKECNHGKLNNPCRVNPYLDDFKAKFIMVKPKPEDGGIENADPRIPNWMDLNQIFSISKEDDFDVDFENPDDNETSNIETLGLRPLYSKHKDYVMEIVEKAAAYNRLTRFDIVDSFQGIFHSETDIFNLIFGRYLSDSEQPNRPLSKLTVDILDQLQIRLEPPVP